MLKLDLTNLDAPVLTHSYAGYVRATNLVHSLGLRASDWLADKAQGDDGRAVYRNTIQALGPAQRQAVALAASERRDFEAAHGRLPGDDDTTWLSQAWQRAASALPAPDDAFAEGPGLDPLFFAVLLDPCVSAPAPERRGSEPARRQPRAASPAPAPAAAAQAAPAPAAAPPPAPAAQPGQAKTAAPPGQGGLDIQGLSGLLSEKFRGWPPDALYELLFVSAELSPPDKKGHNGVKTVFQFFVFEKNGSDKVVTDIKEQEVWICSTEHMANGPRLAAYVEALRLALGDVFASPADTLGRSMPHEFLSFIDVFGLKKATTVDDMRKALLVRSRLGRFLK